MIIRTVFLAALTLAGTAHAEWVKFSEDAESTNYQDPKNIYRNGEIRRVWRLHDLKESHKGWKLGMRSLRILEEFDCKENRYRRLQMDVFNEHMAIGNILVSLNKPTEWEYIAPNTGHAFFLTVICL